MSQYEIKTIKKNNLTLFINLSLELFKLHRFLILRFKSLTDYKNSFIERLKTNITS